jgi:hypothetical protein
MERNGESKYRDGAELCSAVEASDDLLTVTMEDIRKADGRFGKLGPHVQVKLAQWLENEGMAAIPPELKRYQHEEVRVYRAGTTVAELVKAVLQPSESGDNVLRERGGASDGDAQGKLDNIRAIIES